jgi:uncharacterized protein involved in exopolysaccharide biosynthesis
MVDATQQSVQHRKKDDELSVVDLLRILIKRKKIFFVSLIIVPLLVTIAICVVRPVEPLYASTISIQVGTVSQIGQLEQTDVLMKRLKLQYPLIHSIEAGKEGASSILSITVQAADESSATRRLKEIVAQLILDHDAKYTSGMVYQQQKQEILREQIGSIRDQLVEIASSLNATRKKDSAQVSMLVLEKGAFLKELQAKEEAALNLNIAMAEPTSRKTRVIAGPTSLNSSVKPKLEMVIVFGVLLGIMLGIIGVFIAEFMARFNVQVLEENKGG